MPNSPIGSLPYPTLANANNPPADFAALVASLDGKTVTDFTNNSTRDAAYLAWVNAGNTMRNGLMCTVAGVPLIYRNSQWRGLVATSASQQTFFNTTITNATETGVATLAVADPGFPYVLDTTLAVRVAAVGVNVSVRARLDSVSGAVISQDGFRPQSVGDGQTYMVNTAPFPSGTLTGARTVIVTARATSGSGNWNVPADGSMVNCLVRPSFA